MRRTTASSLSRPMAERARPASRDSLHTSSCCSPRPPRAPSRSRRTSAFSGVAAGRTAPSAAGSPRTWPLAQSTPRRGAGTRSPRTYPRTKIAQSWPKLWANFRALIGIFSQSVGPSLAIWANPVQLSLRAVWSLSCRPLCFIGDAPCNGQRPAGE
jgi:hypothetical protein